MESFKSIIKENLKPEKMDKFTNGISRLIQKIDSSMATSDFAKAVAKIMINEYGAHNFSTFKKVLDKEFEKAIKNGDA